MPCLLKVESEGPFAATKPVSPGNPQPMSLIICPKKVDFIPEQLHFRLMTCCIEKFPEEPLLKHNYSLYHVTKDVDLELIYDSKKYIVVSIDRRLPYNYSNSPCRDIRQFLHRNLHEVKTSGLSGFQFSWCIQHSGPAVPVDPAKLVCIDNYKPNQDKPLRRRGRNVLLDSNEKVALDHWFHNQDKVPQVSKPNFADVIVQFIC